MLTDPLQTREIGKNQYKKQKRIVPLPQGSKNRPIMIARMFLRTTSSMLHIDTNRNVRLDTYRIEENGAKRQPLGI